MTTNKHTEQAELSQIRTDCSKALHEDAGERIELLRWLNSEADRWDYFGNKAVAKVLRKAAALLAADKAGGEAVPEHIALLYEAYDFGQFATDFNQPLAQTIRAAIRQLLDERHSFYYTHPQPQPSAMPDDVVKDAEFEVWQGDEMCASTSGPREDALREAMHYAAVYSLDGPAKIYEVTRVEVAVEKK